MSVPRNDFESKEVSMVYDGKSYTVTNKKTGGKRMAFWFYTSRFEQKWKIVERELQLYSDSDISLQMSLNEEGRGGYFKAGLWGIPNEKLEKELELRENEAPVQIVGSYQEARTVMLKELGLPSYATLQAHKRKEAA